ncbi:DNA-binding NtrC family response regulator [Desulfoprunum benzoelyticum]|uniref:DNA-binding NtrC family response regulator n=1 Tax=Desulfoprunum benzoelyticum TaxID=1506996 RepID=A0A840USM3_9BACT|nr:sigma-54-dependent Fis family transcriptional regulator [Desulfoprunum benzoelyticum]MBB5347733.1 DNA-binding NtrC family response regulator [Desulfoprunum benzoelyticum]
MMPNEMIPAAILVVDDEPSLRNTFRTFLKRAGYQRVEAVASFGEAIEAVTARSFDLIICDIVLESHSGIDLLKEFRSLGTSCPVVMITGYPHVETAVEAVRLGAFDYLAKPVEKEVLLKTARLAIRQHRLVQEKLAADSACERYRRFLETLFRSVSDSIVSVDQDLTIVKMNQAAGQLFHALQPALQEGGRLDLLCYNKNFCRLTESVRDVIVNGTEVSDHRLEFFPDGSCRVMSICVSPLDDGTGVPAGAVLVFRDMSRQNRGDEEGKVRLHRLIGASPAMQQVFLMIENIGRVDTTVLITGESGTGKELVAHALHQESSRCNRPLVMVDCAAMPENLLESELFGHRKGAFTGAEENRTGRILQADGGTLFLDEIGDISTAMQLRLLRFLQEKTFYPVGSDREVRVDVRVVAATNADLKEKVGNGSFREDLYYRLLIIDIHLPPLREREGDVMLLANHFLDRYASRMDKGISGISQQAMELFCRYRWPGNVRQLEHAIERACILCQGTTISTEHLPDEILDGSGEGLRSPAPIAEPVWPQAAGRPPCGVQDDQAGQRIVAALRTAGGNKAKAARLLGVDRSTLYRKIRELHIVLDL